MMIEPEASFVDVCLQVLAADAAVDAVDLAFCSSPDLIQHKRTESIRLIKLNAVCSCTNIAFREASLSIDADLPVVPVSAAVQFSFGNELDFDPRGHSVRVE